MIPGPAASKGLWKHKRWDPGNSSATEGLNSQGCLAGTRVAKQLFIFGLPHFRKSNATPTQNSKVQAAFLRGPNCPGEGEEGPDQRADAGQPRLVASDRSEAVHNPA